MNWKLARLDRLLLDGVARAAVLVVLQLAVPIDRLQAQVIPDGSTPTTTDACGATCRITGGTERGENRFHSFREFNVNDGQRVEFANLEQTRNILSRVTGENPSNIVASHVFCRQSPHKTG